MSSPRKRLTVSSLTRDFPKQAFSFFESVNFDPNNPVDRGNMDLITSITSKLEIEKHNFCLSSSHHQRDESKMPEIDLNKITIENLCKLSFEEVSKSGNLNYCIDILKKDIKQASNYMLFVESNFKIALLNNFEHMKSMIKIIDASVSDLNHLEKLLSDLEGKYFIVCQHSGNLNAKIEKLVKRRKILLQSSNVIKVAARCLDLLKSIEILNIKMPGIDLETLVEEYRQYSYFLPTSKLQKIIDKKFITLTDNLNNLFFDNFSTIVKNFIFSMDKTDVLIEIENYLQYFSKFKLELKIVKDLDAIISDLNQIEILLKKFLARYPPLLPTINKIFDFIEALLKNYSVIEDILAEFEYECSNKFKKARATFVQYAVQMLIIHFESIDFIHFTEMVDIFESLKCFATNAHELYKSFDGYDILDLDLFDKDFESIRTQYIKQIFTFSLQNLLQSINDKQFQPMQPSELAQRCIWCINNVSESENLEKSPDFLLIHDTKFPLNQVFFIFVDSLAKCIILEKYCDSEFICLGILNIINHYLKKLDDLVNGPQPIRNYQLQLSLSRILKASQILIQSLEENLFKSYENFKTQARTAAKQLEDLFGKVEEKSIQKLTTHLNVLVNDVNFDPPPPSIKILKLEESLERIVKTIKECMYEGDDYKRYLLKVINKVVSLFGFKVRKMTRPLSPDLQTVIFHDLTYLVDKIDKLIQDDQIFDKGKSLIYFNDVIKDKPS